MKNFLFLLAFSLAVAFPNLGSAQTSVFFPAGKIATEEYVRNYVDSVLKASGPIVLPDKPVLKPCEEGPTLRTISNITEGSLLATFHGKNVYGLDFHILDASGVVRSGKIEPKSSSLPISFQALGPGTYTLRLYGNTCKGKSEKEFRIESKNAGRTERQEAVKSAPKLLFDIKGQGGKYSDVTPGDYIENGQRYRDANGRKYLAFFFINDIPFKNPDDTPRDFSQVELRNGLMISVRKVYAQASWVGTFKDLIAKQNEAWYENKGSDEHLTFKTAFQYFITSGGQDLRTGELTRFQNPDWLDPTRTTPQFWKHNAAVEPNKAVILQNFTMVGNAQQTSDRLRASGVTHLWENTYITSGLANVVNPLKVAQNYSTAPFQSHNPSREKVYEVADSKGLYDEMWVTDEFGEGDFGQWGNNTSLWFYQRLNERAKREGKKVHFVGEYGSQAVSTYQSFREDDKRDPTSDYFLSLLQPDIVRNLVERAGNPGTVLKHYAQSRGAYMGRVAGGYYSTEQMAKNGPDVGVGDWVVAMPWVASLHYNAVPDMPTMFFTWPKMQSNYLMIDVPQRDPGTVRPDGTVAYDFPIAPIELQKVHGFLSCLLYDALYVWDGWGYKPDNDNEYSSPGIGMDAIMVGVQQYTRIQEQAAQADVYACDYSANGNSFTSLAIERRVPKRGQPRYGNRYFNDVADAQCGMALCIPGHKKVFVYINPYASPVEIENVSITYDGVSYDFGEVPGMTLAVARQR
jgi:hypothetical protein